LSLAHAAISEPAFAYHYRDPGERYCVAGYSCRSGVPQNPHVTLGHGGLLRKDASTASYRLSTKGCTSSSLLDVRHRCRSQLAAACTVAASNPVRVHDGTLCVLASLGLGVTLTASYLALGFATRHSSRPRSSSHPLLWPNISRRAQQALAWHLVPQGHTLPPGRLRISHIYLNLSLSWCLRWGVGFGPRPFAVESQ